jgi:HJR/Mrr/RecB family endonuclease
MQEILKKPQMNIVELLQDKLHLPLDKAEILANRIEKQYLQTITDNTKQTPIKLVTKKPVDTKQPPQRETVYALENLSNKEFETFTKWLLQELNYNIQPDSISAFLGVDYIATKDNSKIALIARKYTHACLVSKAAVLMAQQAKHNYQCDYAIVLATSQFSDEAKVCAEKCGVELWDAQKLCQKILEVKHKAELGTQIVFPTYQGTLLASLLALEEHKKFLIEKRVGEKYDVFFPGVTFPLLTFQVQNRQVIRLVYRIKYNEPVGENEGETLIKNDKNNSNSSRLNDAQVYAQVTEYLDQFLE